MFLKKRRELIGYIYKKKSSKYLIREYLSSRCSGGEDAAGGDGRGGGREFQKEVGKFVVEGKSLLISCGMVCYEG